LHPSAGVSVRVLAPPTWRSAATWSQVARLGHYRDLLSTLSRHRINVRYKQSKLGALWAVLQPFTMMLYPKSRHGITDPALVRHSRGMMLDFILEHLKPNDPKETR